MHSRLVFYIALQGRKMAESSLLSLEHASRRYGEKVLLSDVDFYLNEGEKVGLIGRNGSGKTTLLRILAGVDEPDTGVRTQANGKVIRYMPQTPDFHSEDTALAYCLSGLSEEEQWSAEPQARAMLTEFGLPEYDKSCESLSGGQKKRVSLIRTLLLPADILILDEPTNHLDLAMTGWLENYLRNMRTALIMVTHDRYFLDRVVNRIDELDQGKIYSYRGNYAGYLAIRAERLSAEDAAEKKRKNILRTELAWLNRGARARSTKQKAHIDRIETLQAVEGPKRGKSAELQSVSSRLGRTTLEVSGISKSMGGHRLFSNFSYIFLRNDRIGIIGPNGCGKTTLMRILAGELAPDTGTRKTGITLKIGYYRQELPLSDRSEDGYMDPSETVIDYIRDAAEYVRTGDGLVSASVMLDRFLFPPAVQRQKCGGLSGGEKKRLYLLRVLMEAPNLLLLDEPVNDMDIETMAVLEDFLDSFEGIVVTVSHDRFFLDRIVKRVFALEDGTWRQYEGNYSDYAEKSAAARAEAEAETSEKAAQKKAIEPGRTETGNRRRNAGGAGQGNASTSETQERYHSVHRRKLSFNEKREWSVIEDEIASLEQKSADLDRQMEEAATDAAKLTELSAQKEETERALDAKMNRWEELSELVEELGTD